MPVARVDERVLSQLDARRLVEDAITIMFKYDASLPATVGERAVAHRLAVYLERLLPRSAKKLSVDCEYNRDGTDPKLLEAWVDQKRSDGRRRTGLIIPDIIVHERGTNNANFLAIELKYNHRGPLDDDLEKLRELQAEYRYRHVFLVCIERPNVDEITWKIFDSSQLNARDRAAGG